MFRPSDEWGTKEEDALVAHVELGIRFSPLEISPFVHFIV